MGIISSIRERIGAAIAAVIGAIALLGCGALFAFVLSPQQALEARRIERMPLMNATDVAEAPAGKEVLVTGRLADNPLMDEGGFVAYRLQEWIVTLPDPDDPDDEPSGKWETIERLVPDLTLDVNGEIVWILSANDATLSGPLHEELIYSDSYDEAQDGGEWVPHGSLRLRGFFNGDLATVLGKSASTGDIIPQELYAGDRIAFSDSKHQAARGMFIAGICMMILAPAVLVGGIAAGLLGRRR